MSVDHCHLHEKILSSKVYPSFFPLNRSDKILNLGCGEGPQAVMYAKSYALMVGVDINLVRLINAQMILQPFHLSEYTMVCADVEVLPFSGEGFSKAIAIDIIEHVSSPDVLCREAHRLLHTGGELLITFPNLYETFIDMMSLGGKILRFLRLRKSINPSSSGWDPDDHHHRHSIAQWVRLVEDCGFRLVKSKATTLFPPLYLVGIPRFWYRIRLVHKIDQFLCGIPILKRLGQTMLCRFKKVTSL